MPKLNNIDIYLDGLSINEIKIYKSNLVKGFTYNPTLMSKINTKNYLNTCKSLPIYEYNFHGKSYPFEREYIYKDLKRIKIKTF